MATNVVCAETDSNNWFKDGTFEVMCQYDAVTFTGPNKFESVATLATEEDVVWWQDYEALTEAIEDKAKEEGIDPWTACPEIDWSDLGAAMEQLADYMGVDLGD